MADFDLAFPLPLRITFCIIFGILIWAIVLQVLGAKRINIYHLLTYSNPPRPYQAHLDVYYLAAYLGLPFIASMSIFSLMSSAGEYNGFAIFSLILTFVLFAIPRLGPAREGRAHTYNGISRIFQGGIATAKATRFADVVLADALTSYSRILADLYIIVCMTLKGEHSATPDRSCGPWFLLAFVLAYPNAVRACQCYLDWTRSKDTNHLWNLGKYSTGLMVAFVSNLPSVRDHTTTEWYGWNPWLLILTIINSLYTFWWDVVKDWGLSLLSPSQPKLSAEHPFGLRATRIYSPATYYAAVAVDFALRFSWAFKEGLIYAYHTGDESTLFILELVEIFRRGMWLCLRVEWEFIRERAIGSVSAIELLRAGSDAPDP